MTFVVLWLATLLVACYAVFGAGGDQFHHFWHRWEFFAAVSAASYNALIFASVFFLRQRDGRTLDYALGSGLKKLFVFFFRFLVPILSLSAVGVLVWLDRKVDHAADHDHVATKLTVTLIAFASFLLGDLIILSRLRAPEATLPEPALRAWRREFRTHVVYVHVPFVLSYVVLWLLYAKYEGSPPRVELAVQTFLGGASALEVLLQSTVHALSGLADHDA
jgi:hypothetical protein